MKQRKEMRIRDVAVKPVDEDLYKVPPELFYEKPRRVLLVSHFLKKVFFSDNGRLRSLFFYLFGSTAVYFSSI
jgi:hypothetical protein